MNALITAIRTLSILPVPGKESENYADSLPWFPVVGLVLGALLAVLVWALPSIPAEVTAGLILTASALLTRGFHLDGLADCADGFGGGYTRERTLEIMKDSSTGAFGATAIVLSLLLKWVCIKHLILTGNLHVLLIAYTVSRAMQVEQIVRLPYARANGTAASFVQGAKPLHRRLAFAIAILIALGLGGVAGIAWFIVAWLATFLFGRYCLKHVGGITGDLIGTTNELTELLLLFLPLLWSTS